MPTGRTGTPSILLIRRKKKFFTAQVEARGGALRRFSPALLCFQSRSLLIVRSQFRLLHRSPAALVGIFPAIDRRDMRRVSIEIRTSDPKFLLVRIDPLPQLFARGVSLRTVLALNAHDVGGKRMGITPRRLPP
jgi:hypothetical protein